MNLSEFSSYLARTASTVSGSTDVTFSEAFFGFFRAVNWTEPFILSLITLHVTMALLAVLTRRQTTVQTVLWLLLLLAAWMARWLNDLGSQFWREFATQNYFDTQGFFVSVMYTLPLMLICLFIVANFVLLASRLLIQVKRAELRRQRVRKES